MATAPQIHLSKTELEALAKFETSATPDETARVQCIRLAATGLTNQEISKAVGLSHQAVGKWRARYARLGVEGIREPKRGREIIFGDETLDRLIALLRTERGGGKTWSLRQLAEAGEINYATLHKMLRRKGFRPATFISEHSNGSGEFEQ